MIQAQNDIGFRRETIDGWDDDVEVWEGAASLVHGTSA